MRRWIGAKGGRRGLFVTTLVVAVAGTLLLLGPARVEVAQVAVRDLAPAVHGVGTVEAKVVVQIGAKVTGRIVAVLVGQGDAVRAGQALVRLDDEQLAAEERRSAAAVDVAAAQLRDLTMGARAEEIGEARANVARARA